MDSIGSYIPFSFSEPRVEKSIYSVYETDVSFATAVVFYASLVGEMNRLEMGKGGGQEIF